MHVLILNNNFVAIKFDAEYQNSVTFNNNSYKYVRSGRKGINELAYYLQCLLYLKM